MKNGRFKGGVMRFLGPILYVKNVVKSLEFYEAAFGFKKKFLHESQDYAELETEEGTLAFVTHDLAQMNLEKGYQTSSLAEKPLGFELAIAADNPVEAYEKALKAGAVSVSEPKPKPWGQDVAYVRDIDGFLIEIGSPMK